jgi:uncharacterized membrane protein
LVKLTVPLTVLPVVGASTALAVGALGGVAQADTKRVASKVALSLIMEKVLGV